MQHQKARTLDHKHDNDDSISDDISRQADEILARLNNVSKPDNVSQPVVADQEEQILADIQLQQREVADSHLLDAPEQPQPSLQLPAPVLHQDDSGMLVVNPEAEADSTVEADEPETFSMTDSPISSGRASRMDYEKLFDRLRNLPDGGQQ